MIFKSLPDILHQHYKKTPEKPVLYEQQEGKYYAHTWESIYLDVSSVVHGLVEKGVKEGDRIGLWSSNSPSWVILDMAILILGAVVIPLYPSLSRADVSFILNDANIDLVFYETEDMGNILKTCQNNHKNQPIPHLKIAHLKRLFPTITITSPYLDPFLKKISSNNIASIVYTSGTTGRSKGVVLTHKNFLSNVQDVLQVIPLHKTDSALSFLPLSHVFERTVGYYTVLAAGLSIYYARSIQTVADDILIAKPSIVIGVPRFYEKVHTKITQSSRGFKKIFFNLALKIGKSAYLNNKPISLILLPLAKTMVFKKIKHKLGGRIRLLISGGAPLGKHTFSFFESLGFILIEGYGLTESSPIIACNRIANRKAGSVGMALPSVSVKTSKDGELLAKGPNIMREYLNSPRETAFSLKDDWLATGDIAKIDSEGFIYIIDRKKELIVLSNGKKVAPLLLESALTKHDSIEQAMIIGDKRSYIAALILPNTIWLEKYLKKTIRLPEDIQRDSVKNIYTKLVKSIMLPFSSYSRVKNIILISDPFTEENGLLTPTQKVKRKKVITYYEKEINKAYTV